MADRYERYDRGGERDRERYWDRDRDWDRGREAGSRFDDRRDWRTENYDRRTDRSQFDRGDRERDYDRERWRGNEPYRYGDRYDRENEEFRHASREDWRWRNTDTGRNLGGGMAAYSGQDWRMRSQGPYSGGAGESWDRERSYGRFTGRGPKNYQRSDERIREDVCEHLTQHPGVDASEIEVQVNNGEVTLSGSVEDRHQKRTAEDMIENISGVREVHNNIHVSKALAQRIGEALGFSSDRETETTRR